MKKFTLTFALSSAFCFSQLFAFAQSNDASSVWVTINKAESVPVLQNDQWKSADAQVQKLLRDFDVTSINKAVPDSKQEALQKVYELTCNCDGDAFVEALNRNEAFSQAEPAPQYSLLNSSPEPNDYNLQFNEDYALDLINAQNAWEFTTGNPQVILGVSDGSFLSQHEDLQNKYVSMTNSQGVTMYYYYHGTAVATGVAGSTNNGSGKSAIGYDCKLALNTIGYNQMLQLAYGGARVINVSWSSGCWYSPYYQMIIDEISDLGVVIVASAGNGGTCGGADNLVYPSALDGVISVTSVGPNDNHERAIGDPNSTHQHNSTVDLCAPGYDVALTIAPGVYMTGNGTSFASPYVTGTIGLMLSIRPCLTPTQIEDILKLTAADVYSVNPADYYGKLGAGRLDAGAAIAYVYNMMPCSDLTSPTVVTPPTTVGSGVGVMSANNNVAPIAPVDNVQANEQEISNSSREQNGLESVEPFTAKLFPNPTNDIVNIQWNTPQDFQLEVYGPTGALIDSKEINHTINSTRLDIEHTGVYMIRMIRDGQTLWHQRVIRL